MYPADMTGRVAVVTGAASGIGLAIVQALADRGAAVVLADQNSEVVGIAEAMSGGGADALGYQVDVTRSDDVEACMEATLDRFGKIDILVHSAGIGIEKNFLELSLDEWQKIIDVDLTGTFVSCQAAARHMVSAGYGRIITISSTAGIRGGFRRAAYGAAKGGVIALTRVMAVELGPLGVTVNTIAPGAIDTSLVAKMHSPETRRIYTNAIPLYRYGTPEETASAALYLASDEAAYINGHVLTVDGGFASAGLMDPHEQAAKAGLEPL